MCSLISCPGHCSQTLVFEMYLDRLKKAHEQLTFMESSTQDHKQVPMHHLQFPYNFLTQENITRMQAKVNHKL